MQRATQVNMQDLRHTYPASAKSPYCCIFVVALSWTRWAQVGLHLLLITVSTYLPLGICGGKNTTEVPGNGHRSKHFKQKTNWIQSLAANHSNMKAKWWFQGIHKFQEFSFNFCFVIAMAGYGNIKISWRRQFFTCFHHEEIKGLRIFLGEVCIIPCKLSTVLLYTSTFTVIWKAWSGERIPLFGVTFS